MFSSLRDGIRRVNRGPAIVVSVWAITVLVSLPLTLALRGMLAEHLDRSLAAETAAASVNYDWMQEFADRATGLGMTFRPTIIGFGAVLDNLSAFIDRTPRPPAIVGAAAAYILFWLFAAGGILDRYARDRAIGARAFVSVSGVFFVRFLRLAVVQGIVYLFLIGYLHAWLFDRLYPRITHDVHVERTAFLVRLALYAVFGILVSACVLIFDYAKVCAVVEDRRSMIGAVGSALGFVRRNTKAAVGLFALNLTLFATLVGVYALVAPGAGRDGASILIGLAIGQAYVGVRLWVKLVFWASETALFQRRLAPTSSTRPVPPSTQPPPSSRRPRPRSA
jgi:hypothetical protein